MSHRKDVLQGTLDLLILRVSRRDRSTAGASCSAFVC